MNFIDEVSFTIRSGKGGDGCVGFRREKFVPRGGPDGGDGGRGGDVFAVATSNLNTLYHFRGKKTLSAQPGGPGRGHTANGKKGDDLILDVPLGTLVRESESGEVLFDLNKEGEKVLLAQGGRGGFGNTQFKSSTNQAPHHAQDGGEAEEKRLTLELKLLADAAFVGLPNAGKSTLLSVLSAAKPKIADYAFTTLTPQLGVMEKEGKTLVLADIPGLIEDASEGKGLGLQFLKHIERSQVLVHLIDISWCLEPFEAFESYITVRQELEKFNPDLLARVEIVVLNKVDAMDSQEVQKYVDTFESQLDKKVLPLSGVAGTNLDELKNILLEARIESKKREVDVNRL